MNRIGTIAVAVLIAGLLPPTAEAGMLSEDGVPTPRSIRSNTSGQLSAVDTKTRPCSDFLKAQGTLNNPPLFFPPVPDYVGWTDKPFTTFGLIDYAGLAAEYIKDATQKSLGTKVTCSVTEGALTDGSAKISVTVFTTNALGFAQDAKDLKANGFDFLNTPTNFGAKAQDVVNGAEPALGPATLDVSFRIPQPKDPLPDLVDVLVNSPCSYKPVNVQFESSTYGKRPDETKALLHISQAGSSTKNSCLNFTDEVVEIVPTQ
jgi:hypothetical protein